MCARAGTWLRNRKGREAAGQKIRRNPGSLRSTSAVKPHAASTVVTISAGALIAIGSATPPQQVRKRVEDQGADIIDPIGTGGQAGPGRP